MFNRKFIAYLKQENSWLRNEHKRLNSQVNELINKVMALSNEGALVLSNGSDALSPTKYIETELNQWGEEVVKIGEDN